MTKLDHPKRVLHIVSSMGRGGAETLIMNIYRNIDRKKLQFDFITHSKASGDFDDEIKSMGGTIYNISSLGTKGPMNYIKQLVNVMSSNDYVAVHAHTDYQSGFPALAAKICGIKNRICHSHSNFWLKSNSFKTWFTLKILQALIKSSATKFCSCSEEAAEFLFGKRTVINGGVHILKNGIDISEYIDIEANSRESVLKELDLSEDTKIVGHVGRFSESKNHKFILKIMKKLVEEDNRFTAVLIGDGPLRKTIEMEAKKLRIRDHIKFLGVRSDIPRLMNAFDVFLFPSLFEGFGIVMLEAQCSGTPCIASDFVPKSTDMELGLVKYFQLEDDIDKWCDGIKAAVLMDGPTNNSRIKNISKLGFNIQENLNDWLKLYGIQSQ
ncbi:glycosyltransferase family 1 protein [Siminovitchia acidinfaciens]|uniref:Glycosyltransferase family 1 protein n=1 Tax=Siminovitchia acidinfaciens TaxID=2321395 RepID=A0A429XW04_9BACI|nr:glycosyltransferase family 1 protein [Siminovitchia acidinfaciens]RST72548.1 glycosyltransferase family 1 protein [Siminovitchia acidinfaciens]